MVPMGPLAFAGSLFSFLNKNGTEQNPKKSRKSGHTSLHWQNVLYKLPTPKAVGFSSTENKEPAAKTETLK